jgi:hypothetical protein
MMTMMTMIFSTKKYLNNEVMEDLKYDINKGVNRPVEFRGLRAQYIYYLAIGLALLLIGFSVMYIAGVPVYLCVPVVFLVGSGLFWGVYRLSHRYGEHGLMKAIAFRQVPPAICTRSLKLFSSL